MKYIIYFVFPIGVFCIHLILLWFIVYLSIRERKLSVALVNILVYPVVLSFLISCSLLIFFGYSLDIGVILSGLVWGIVGYYFSLALSFVPLFGPFFREPDLEFFLLGMGTVVGIDFSHPFEVVKKFGPFISKHSFAFLLSILGALLLATTVRVLFRHAISSPVTTKEDALKDIAWIASISAGVIGLPLVYLFQSIRIGG